jgi:hypothetical protein
VAIEEALDVGVGEPHRAPVLGGLERDDVVGHGVVLVQVVGECFFARHADRALSALHHGCLEAARLLSAAGRNVQDPTQPLNRLMLKNFAVDLVEELPVKSMRWLRGRTAALDLLVGEVAGAGSALRRGLGEQLRRTSDRAPRRPSGVRCAVRRVGARTRSGSPPFRRRR